MLFLFEIQDGGQSRQVPVAERTAAALERALLALDSAGRQAVLAEAIAADPALAVWAVLETRRPDSTRAATATQAAAWLGERLTERLVHGLCRSSAEGGGPALVRLPAEDADRYAASYAAALARGQAQRAESSGGELADDAAYFAALVAPADEFLAIWPANVADEKRLLPTFPPVPVPKAWTADLRRAPVEELVGLFLDHEPGIEWRLPALVAMLDNYEQRLADFDGRLEQEKLESLKELAYGASHEINNPLANIAARAQTLLREETDPERQRKLTAIHRQAMRAHEMIADLMLFARPPRLHRVFCDLRDLARRVVEEQAESAAEHRIELACDGDETPVLVEGDETQLAVAIGALVTNALEAVGNDGRVDVAVRQTAVEDHAWAEVAVSDDGPGISAEVRQHMFDPFYSGREAGRGLGFGLSKCWRIVTDHGGQMIVGQSAQRGAELTMLLPLAQQPAQR
jgi:signal transduction histidine kinase